MSLKDEMLKYNEKCASIPVEFNERIQYVIDENNINEKDITNLPHLLKSYKKAEWKSFSFVIYLYPKATPRPRYSGRSSKFYVSGASEDKTFFKKFMNSLEEEINPGIIVTPVKAHIKAYIETPKLMNRVEKLLSELGFIYPISKPDIDNMAKKYFDMITGHLLLDDALIVSARQDKFYSCKPRIEIEIKYLEHYDSNYNKKKVENWKWFKQSKYTIDDKKIIE